MKFLSSAGFFKQQRGGCRVFVRADLGQELSNALYGMLSDRLRLVREGRERDVLELGEREHVLMINQHHIISDGWSVKNMFADLKTAFLAYQNREPLNWSLQNVGEAGKTRQTQPKKRSLRSVNEHSEAVFNDVLPTQVALQGPARWDEPAGTSPH